MSLSGFERLDVSQYKEHPDFEDDLILCEVIRDSHAGAYFFVCAFEKGQEFLQGAPALTNGELCIDSGLSDVDWICSKQKDYFTEIGYKQAVERIYVMDGECCNG